MTFISGFYHPANGIAHVPMTLSSSERLRRILLWLLLFGLGGTTVELGLLEHYEDASMTIPFVAVVLAVTGALGRIVRPSAASVRWLRASMLPTLIAGVIGVYLHYLGGLEFQADMDPTLPRWQLFWKVLHMQAPPMLAPGVLVQFALLGLASTYRDPLMSPSPTASDRGEQL